MTNKSKGILNSFLYTIFTISLTISLLGVLVNSLLSSEIYKTALVETNFYDRIYSEYFADPNTAESLKQNLSGTGLEDVSDEILSISTSTLYLIFPPTSIQKVSESILDQVFLFLRGDTDKIEVNEEYLIKDESPLREVYSEQTQDILNAIDRKIDNLSSELNNIRSFTSIIPQVILPISFLIYFISVFGLVYINKNHRHKVAQNIGLILSLVGILGLFVIFLLNANYQTSANSEGVSMIGDFVSSVISNLIHNLLVLSGIIIFIGVFLYLIALPNIKDKFVTKFSDSKHGIINIFIGVLMLIVVLNMISRIIEQNQPMKCNGYEELCERRLNEVAFPTTHNSMSIAEYQWLWPSHDGTILDQLNYGIRGFLIDTHYYDTVASINSYFPDATEKQLAELAAIFNRVGIETYPGNYLCHMACILGSTSFAKSLSEVKEFLDENPNEVLVFIIEDKITPEDTEEAFVISGLDQYLYTHKPGNEWPTLRELIEDNTRVIVMAEVEGPGPQWYQNAWANTEETPYAFHDVSELQAEDSCRPNRGDTGKDFFLMNHWIERVSPSRVDSSIVNDYDFLLERAQRCQQERGKIPNFVAVNFYLNGDVLKVVNTLNGVGE